MSPETDPPPTTPQPYPAGPDQTGGYPPPPEAYPPHPGGQPQHPGGYQPQPGQPGTYPVDPAQPGGYPGQVGGYPVGAGGYPPGTAQPVGYPPPPAPTPAGQGLAAAVVIGCVVAVVLGVYGRLHEPAGFSINLAGFSSGAYAKAWLGTLAASLAVVQVLSSLVLYGKLMTTAPPWIGALHRWSGRLAVISTVPVVIHCLFALGFEVSSTRVVIHSLVGCLFYGAFVSKMLCLSRPNISPKALPVLGGVVFTTLIALWLTSSLWLFDTQGFTL